MTTRPALRWRACATCGRTFSQPPASLVTECPACDHEGQPCPWARGLPCPVCERKPVLEP
jgi:hypothetical protein